MAKRRVKQAVTRIKTEKPPRLVEGAVAAARRFQTESFDGQVFSVSSADLIREARDERTA